jgi:hypothetical protein
MFLNMLLLSVGGSNVVTIGVGTTTPAVYLYKGFLLIEMYATPTGVDFHVRFSGYAGAQNDLFTTITVKDQSNNDRVFTAASATTYGSGIWTWGTGASPVWTAGGVSRTATFT